jgi:hypothetical protein
MEVMSEMMVAHGCEDGQRNEARLPWFECLEFEAATVRWIAGYGGFG